MQLGDFLKDIPESPVEPVTFRVLWQTDRARQGSREVKAVLAFVDAYEISEARRDAKAAVDEANSQKKVDAPPLDFEDEVIYHLLLRALRDSDDPRKQFASSVVQLKKALIPDIAAALYRSYKKFIQREFPEVVSDTERAKMEEDASGES